MASVGREALAEALRATAEGCVDTAMWPGDAEAAAGARRTDTASVGGTAALRPQAVSWPSHLVVAYLPGRLRGVAVLRRSGRSP